MSKRLIVTLFLLISQHGNCGPTITAGPISSLFGCSGKKSENIYVYLRINSKLSKTILFQTYQVQEDKIDERFFALPSSTIGKISRREGVELQLGEMTLLIPTWKEESKNISGGRGQLEMNDQTIHVDCHIRV